MNRVLQILVVSVTLVSVQVLLAITLNTIRHDYASDKFARPMYPEGAPDLSGNIPQLRKNESFGACIMLKEDNELLYEWLAYHYTVLPLRYVFVGSDLGNQQNPSDVLKRWTIAKTGLQYWVRNATEFMNRHGEHRDIDGDDERLSAHHRFIHRQRGFITYCSDFMKKQGLNWVTFIDSDEYIVSNRIGDDDADAEISPIRLSMRRAIPNDTEVTVLEIIHQLTPIMEFGPCHTMPRLLHGSLENVTCGDEGEAAVQLAKKNNLQYSEMSTLRFHQHSRKGDFAASKFGKVIMDVSNLTFETLAQRPRNPHRPFKPECGHPVVHFPDAILYVNHYIGSWSRYSSRNDTRRNRNEWEQRAFIDTASSCDKAVYSWFPRFVQQVGIDRARFLLGTSDSFDKSNIG